MPSRRRSTYSRPTSDEARLRPEGQRRRQGARSRCGGAVSTTAGAGAVISGDTKKIKEVVDIWTFAREVASRDPNWRLIATQAPS